MKKSQLIKIIKEETLSVLTENVFSKGTFKVSVAGKVTDMNFEQLKSQPKEMIVLQRSQKMSGFDANALSAQLGGGIKIGYTDEEVDKINELGPEEFLRQNNIVWVFKYIK
tara:strand:+ start:64 stop:396 length:333 start_codon:yes stop_codon:yes gene_type:complete